MYSSTVIEAEKFNIPSVVTKQYGSEFYPEQRASGWAVPAYTYNEIIKAIEHQLNKRDSFIKAKKGDDSLNSNQALEELLHMIGK
jgi:hypothetical protein